MLLSVAISATSARLRDAERWVQGIAVVFWAYIAWSLAAAARAVLIDRCVDKGTCSIIPMVTQVRVFKVCLYHR